MDKLTVAQMWAAHFVRFVDSDPDLVKFDGVEKARAWAFMNQYSEESVYKEMDEAAAKYAAGSEVLEKYGLTYSERTPLEQPKAPDGVCCYIVVPAGYTATTQMYQLAMFTHKS